jgi:hypothetical protein
MILVVRDQKGAEMSVAAGWRLSKTCGSAGGAVAYEVLGDGAPVVLVHGTPSWSCLWPDVAANCRQSGGTPSPGGFGRRPVTVGDEKP